MSWIWCDGGFLEGKLAVSPLDRGLANGLGLFETLLANDGQPVALERHLARMGEGAARLRWTLDTGPIGPAIVGLLGRCGLETGRARVRVAMTAGAGELRDLERGGDALLWITAAACPPPRESMVLVSADFPRNERSPLAGLKCASYAENLIALDQARRAGADEALFFNTRGELCEAATANVFLVRDGRIFTPALSSGCLPGTMRARVMAMAPVSDVDLTIEDLAVAEEIFLTSATRGIVPVSCLDDRVLGRWPVAAELRERIESRCGVAPQAGRGR